MVLLDTARRQARHRWAERARGLLMAAFACEDSIRADAKATIAQLQAAGVGVSIASGDRPQAVAEVAAQLGITTAHSEMSPEAKLTEVRALRDATGHEVDKAGNGILRLVFANVGEDRYKRYRKSALAKNAAQKVRNSKSDEKRIGEHAGAEKLGKRHVPDQPRDTGHQGHGTSNAARLQ